MSENLVHISGLSNIGKIRYIYCKFQSWMLRSLSSFWELMCAYFDFWFPPVLFFLLSIFCTQQAQASSPKPVPSGRRKPVAVSTARQTASETSDTVPLLIEPSLSNPHSSPKTSPLPSPNYPPHSPQSGFPPGSPNAKMAYSPSGPKSPPGNIKIIPSPATSPPRSPMYHQSPPHSPTKPPPSLNYPTGSLPTAASRSRSASNSSAAGLVNYAASPTRTKAPSVNLNYSAGGGIGPGGSSPFYSGGSVSFDGSNLSPPLSATNPFSSTNPNYENNNKSCSRWTTN